MNLSAARVALRSICCPNKCFSTEDIEDEDTAGLVGDNEDVPDKHERRRVAARTSGLAPDRIAASSTVSDAQLEQSANNQEVEVVDLSVASLIHKRRLGKVLKDAARPWYYTCCPFKDEDTVLGERPLADNYTLFCFSSTNPFRVWCAVTCRQQWFQNLVLAMIIVSSITLAVDVDPTRQESGEGDEALLVIDIIFVTLFVIEAFIKIVATGFVGHKSSYLRSAWNVLDFIVIVASLFSLVASSDLQIIRVLRVVRALRPLRTIKRAPSLRVVVEALTICLPSFLNVMLLCFFVYLVFAIIAVQIFTGV